MNSDQILDREFLQIRAKILEVAAALDRLDRAEGDVSNDPRMKLISDGIKLIAAEQNDAVRAEKIQLLFSREYDANWVEAFEVATRT